MIIEQAVWAAVVFFGVLDLLLVAERVEHAVERYHAWRSCRHVVNATTRGPAAGQRAEP